jgi:DNA processing protein
VPGRDEQAAVLALVAKTTGEWHRTAELIEGARSALRIVHGEWTGFEPHEIRVSDLVAAVDEAGLARYAEMIESLEARDVRLLTVLDVDYPANLRQVYNRPPFLWVRGSLRPQDDRAVAVVGTRQASAAGIAEARSLAEQLANRGVTVLSGLARGIDAAAHQAALDAGGRTIAVMGTGINRVYPAEHSDLAERIVESGALVSQFWPDSPPARWSFPMRNVVMSGLAVGTVVVEASSASGAKMQARLALEHGKRLFLVESLVMREAWAKRYAEHPAATVVQSVDNVVDVLAAAAQRVEQLVLG